MPVAFRDEASSQDDRRSDREALDATAVEPLLPRYTAGNEQPDHEMTDLPLSSGRKHVYSPDAVDVPEFAYRSPNSRPRRPNRIIQSLLIVITTLLVLLLITPLVLLFREGLLIDGLRQAASNMAGAQGVNKDLATRPHANAELFPTDIGFAGPTPTGKEPALILTAPHLPLQTAQPPLLSPASYHSKPSSSFNVMQHWGQLSPWFSVDSFGLPKAEGVKPESCEIKGLHYLQRHGSRYSVGMSSGPKVIWNRLRTASDWKASGPLDFLNDFEYKLGAEVLTPFGRQQLFNLGVSARVKYGFLLDTFTDHVPIFRTESQDRMLKSAQNFAAGFFGIPVEDQYNLEVTIESPGYNNTLAPYSTCRNDNSTLQRSTNEKLAQWDEVFLADAVKRLNKHIDGLEVSISDAKDFMEMCAYETVALGYSSFCELFTEQEWKGFQYRYDIMWWYSASFGSPVGRAEGIGWVQELVSRLTHTRITEFNSTTNATFHNDVQFPLNDALYVDFTHDTTFAQLLPTLNLTFFAEGGPLPLDHIPKGRKFISSKFCPFATHMEFQILSCGSEEYIRLLLNDGVVPLTGLEGCPEDDDGKCPMSGFVSSLQKIIGEVDFAKECLGEDVDLDDLTTNGSPGANWN